MRRSTYPEQEKNVVLGKKARDNSAGNDPSHFPRVLARVQACMHLRLDFAELPSSLGVYGHYLEKFAGQNSI